MSDSKEPDTPQAPSSGDAPKLYPDDQARVDEFLKKGVNSVERKPFKPLYLLIMLIVVVAGLSLFSQWLATWAGVH